MTTSKYNDYTDDFAYAKQLMQYAPRESRSFLDLKHNSERNDGVIPPKYRELISLAVALTTQCTYCIDVHTRQALKDGASNEELSETVFIAAALRAGAAVGQGLLMMRIAEQAQQNVPAP